MKEKATKLPRRRPNQDARGRTGFLFNPGDPMAQPNPEHDLTDGTLYHVVRWKLERPCLVRHNESTTLCGKDTSHSESVTSRPAGGREPLCATCLSKSGRGVVR